MSEPMERQLLDALLDKYERSTFYRDGTQPTRRILLKLYDRGQTDFPAYDIEHREQHALCNRAVLALAEKELVSYAWMKSEEGHILASVWLNLDHLQEAYAYAERKSKNDMVDEVLLELLDALEQLESHTPSPSSWSTPSPSSWGVQYFEKLYENISRRREVGSSLPTDPAERRDLFRAILFLNRLKDTELVERVFSMQCFGDSKRFERAVRPRLLSILRKMLDVEEDTRDEDLLRQVGITKYPEQFEFCGPLRLNFETGSLDYSCLQLGGTLCLPDFIRADIEIDPGTEKVLSIENRANYIDYIQNHRDEHTLVLYHGGQYSPSKKVFFQTIARAMPPTCRWHHWGDIDYGGFSMLARLRREIAAEIQPYRMHEDELVRYDALTAPVRDAYIEKLLRLMNYPDLWDCAGCILYMIQQRKRLEQEAMLT